MFGFHHRGGRHHEDGHHFGGHRFRGHMAGGRGGFGGGFGWDMERGPRGGRRRVFEGGELRLVLLALLEAQPRHGYDLIREIEERTGGAYAPSPGVVYPTLTLLDEMGLLDEVREEGARRRFAITDAGRAHLEEKKAEVEALLGRLAEMGAHRARTDRAPIRRAMMSLGMALREKMSEADGETDRAHDVAAILDEATSRIERL